MEICGIKHLRIEYMNARRSPEAMFESCEDIFHGGGRELKPKLYEFALISFHLHLDVTLLSDDPYKGFEC